MRRFLLIFFLFSTVSLSAQTSDSLAVVSAQWQTDTLDGFLLRRVQFSNKDCLGSNQYICVLELPPSSPCSLAFTHTERRTRTSQQAQSCGALAAVNGSYFDMKLHNPICYLRIDSVLCGVNTPQASDSIHRKYYQYGAISLVDGRPRFFVPDSGRMAEDLVPGRHIMTAGPMLVYNGRLVPQRADRTFVSDRHNRTAIGVRDDGTVLLVTLDGRTRHSEGMSLFDFQRLLRYLGCRHALNLDGGGSTTMYVKDFPNDGIVNYPSDNMRFDHAGQRTVSNCIVIMKGKHRHAAKRRVH